MATKDWPLQAVSTGGTSAYGKNVIAVEMFYRGRESTAAALLLRRHSGQSYMTLYLLCQAVELVGKAALLLHDYDRFKPKLRTLGHDLEALLATCEREFRLDLSAPDFRKELLPLNNLYRRHQRLRYASDIDLFIDPKSLESTRLLRKLFAAMRLAQPHLPKSFRRP